ncbi:hypothetical protein MMYC01_206532 [Madurella mycetomatis]|uniref:Uncharacterized protein n=1 Tax=Madurella mycetomatis TaxID=100816 RepID=A0A175W034_9PEZI|nr:hypothetical protein MMYC01_206532 [Madurella mycetomatis]
MGDSAAKLANGRRHLLNHVRCPSPTDDHTLPAKLGASKCSPQGDLLDSVSPKEQLAPYAPLQPLLSPRLIKPLLFFTGTPETAMIQPLSSEAPTPPSRPSSSAPPLPPPPPSPSACSVTPPTPPTTFTTSTITDLSSISPASETTIDDNAAGSVSEGLSAFGSTGNNGSNINPIKVGLPAIVGGVVLFLGIFVTGAFLC